MIGFWTNFSFGSFHQIYGSHNKGCVFRPNLWFNVGITLLRLLFLMVLLRSYTVK
jgi:hypothetical protein